MARRGLADRLWSRCERTATGCLEFRGYRRPPYFYGQISLGGRAAGIGATHRVAWELTYGPIPEGLVVRHKCDNPPCCEPTHLELGTQAQNVGDMIERGRQALGDRLPQTKLTDAQIVDIRDRVAAGELQRVVAADFGVTQGYVSTVCAGIYRGRVSA
jgi:hypothetical protein